MKGPRPGKPLPRLCGSQPWDPCASTDPPTPVLGKATATQEWGRCRRAAPTPLKRGGDFPS